jgi:hypothetical protein
MELFKGAIGMLLFIIAIIGIATMVFDYFDSQYKLTKFQEKESLIKKKIGEGAYRELVGE